MTKLIRVQEETYNQLQKLAGKMQAKHGTRFSLDKAIQSLLEERTVRRGTPGPEKGETKAEAEEFANSLKWFSMHHKAFKAEKDLVSSTKIEQRTGPEPK